MPIPMPLQGLKAAQPMMSPMGGPPGAGGSSPGVTPPGSSAAYQGPEQGPFKCSNCTYFMDPDQCSKPEVIQEQGGIVDPEGCCNYFTSLSMNDMSNPNRLTEPKEAWAGERRDG
jgi:hypothetical protein